MYCPRCAAQNLDDVKFCRACGTNLEMVALALSDQHHPAKLSKGKDEEPETEKSWLEKRREGMDGIVKGTGLMGASLLIGVALGLFSNAPDWIIIWAALAGWMACWGFISMVSGIGALAESRFMRRQLGQTASASTAPAAQPLSSGNRAMLPDALDTPKLSHPPSVTEQTTQPLTKQHQTSKQVS
jgi:zinc-ribbon domain